MSGFSRQWTVDLNISNQNFLDLFHHVVRKDGEWALEKPFISANNHYKDIYLSDSSHFMKTLISIVSFLFLAAKCNSQTTPKTDSIVASLQLKYKLSEYDKLDNIMCFNKDTILISGYLGDNSTSAEIKNIVYQTFDGGKTWKTRHFKGNAWIYDTHFENDGKVWMGGSDEYIHFSTDYGTNWTKKPKPFKPINRVLTIYMLDSLNGIAGGLDNGLATTNDNWETTKQIPSPLDQNKFTITTNSARSRIDKVQIIDSLILINQNEHIYYSKLNPIQWTSFNIPTTNFSINKSANTINLYSIRGKVYVLDSKLTLKNSYTETEDKSLMELATNKNINLSNFLSSDINLIKIKAVKYDFDKMVTVYYHSYALYKENINELVIKEKDNIALLKNMLATENNYSKPFSNTFRFTKEDFENYIKYYTQTKNKREEEKVWGGDFTYLINIDNTYFSTPEKAVDSLSQSLLDPVFKSVFFYPNSFNDKEPYIILYMVNNKSDTLKITSRNSNLFRLPWTIEFNSETFLSYDTRITEFLRTVLPKEFNNYDSLFAGELIYKLIEQRITNEMTYQNGY